jgi:PAS domain S-box-containing protein
MTDQYTRRAFNRQLLRALLVPLLLLILFPFIGYAVISHLAEVVRLDRHSVEVLASASELEKSFIDLETGVRGFQLTGDTVFLEPYDAATPLIPAQFMRVRQAVADSAEQTQRLEVVQRDFEGWNAFATEAVSRVRSGVPRDREFYAAGKALMDRTRGDMAAFLDAEQRLLDERSRTVGPAKQTAILWMVGLFLGVIGILFWWSWRQMRKLAETYELALRTTDLEKERFRVTLASIGDAVIVTDRDGAVNFLNSEAERMTGWSLAEARGHPLRTIFRIINEESRQLVEDPVEKVFKEHRVVGLANHTVLISKTGVEWMIEDSAAPIFDAERKISGVVLVFQDAGVRRRAQKALMEARDQAVAASQAKDDFLAALSHELRTPLNPVLLLASENSNRPELPGDVRQDFTTIAKNVMIESRLIDDLLDLTRITNRKLSLDLEVMDAGAVLREAVDKVSAEISEKGLHLDAQLGNSPAWVKGDAIRLQQVFWNILKNAVKFTPAGGRVTAQALVSADGKGVVVQISDTGLGLTPGELERAFEPFVQGQHAEKTGAHRFGGLGLGLAIARSIIELHGGSIEAASPGRDQGATFTIKLALTAAPRAGLRPSENLLEQAASLPLPPHRILLVEDHEATRTALADLLRKRGCQVTTGDTVASALAAAEKSPFDLVISDLGLPDGNGAELMRTLRQKYGLAGIATSGFGTEADIAKGRAAGFLTHLIKPLVISQLEHAILKGPWAKPADEKNKRP